MPGEKKYRMCEVAVDAAAGPGMLLEVIVTSVEDALEAERGGAGRLSRLGSDSILCKVFSRNILL